ncbi:S-adenosyl-L-methionine-dependent methyltransferase [Protomyces lactucae-debilis]|uniref:S-adenosyl-L-methionine-dependent methyltransferase n=1 Tax=Protomyces lactucae-debilis TaxID=2754530 RepID=A0A1Y2F5C2_PROLT|nr:S-adenosyl-L-methionine-dependent methyltransferase [Protomyces lactucae-debilis]ORY79061.1 S-adenosyl-L-methionine-dependent methyltransferase [Protomyces lactucae-debilis]
MRPSLINRMAKTLAFSEKSFDSSSYADFRPTYGIALFDQLFMYHQSSSKVAVDLGCGTGQITSILAERFEKVIGFDTSAKMLEAAIKHDRISYQVGSAESLPLEDGSVDLVTVGQAAHWFDKEKWFKEMHRVIKPGGTLSFWSYNEIVFTDSPAATKVWNQVSHADDKLGPHWPQPGRSILEEAMDGFDLPESLFSRVERHYTAQRGSQEPSPVAKQTTLLGAAQYMRTASAFHNWRAANGNPVSRAAGGAGDAVDEAIDEIKRQTGWTDDSKINVHWPTVAVYGERR